MKNFKAIVFDLGGVILDIDYHLTREAFENLGISDFDDMYSQAAANQLFQHLETGHISAPDFFRELRRCTGIKLTDQEITNAWNAMLLQYREPTLEYILELKKQMPVYLFSNTNFIHMEAFLEDFMRKPRPQAFNDYFTKAYYSCEIGFRKPDTESFQFIIDELGLPPEEILFIDDSLQNVASAGELDIQTIYFKPGMKVEELGLLPNN